MSFTDDDLKRLKEDLQTLKYPPGCINRTPDLLSRLEAAEKVISESFDHNGRAFIGLDDWYSAYEAWLKEAGKP